MQRLSLCLLFLCGSHWMHATILVIDFGCTATPYIKQHVESAHVQCIVRDYTITNAEISAINPSGVLLSGSPFSVYNPGSPQIPQLIFDLQIPIFGICYGEQLLGHQLGGRVEHMGYQERGPIELTVIDTCLLTQDIWQKGDVVLVWMSHQDRVVDLPTGFTTIAYTASSPYAIIADEERRYYGVQFHPEVPKNSWPQLIHQFVLSIVGEEPDYEFASTPQKQEEEILRMVCSCCLVRE